MERRNRALTRAANAPRAVPHYFDGISFMRAISVAKDDPWSQFEPEYFGNYRNTMWAPAPTDGRTAEDSV
jgi:hypothetical protein